YLGAILSSRSRVFIQGPSSGLDTMRVRIRPFVIGIVRLGVGECSMASMNKDMDISRLMAYAYETEKKKVKIAVSKGETAK
ncbi:hypothetical protein HAX54_033273, partial [Datura stramonium]|nr:hypothetical protein [Datura stramonium]